uniref:Sorting nexin 17 n=1 Tax=Eptatretus burgeri TaxID=7764 RepID=A0A8C4QX78_EPTBU
MHFSVPDTEERADETGITYIAYNIHVNGAFHCRVRFSQLHALNEQLKKDIGSILPYHFPPKRLLSLTTSQVEQRREQLERYIQLVTKPLYLQETQQVPTEDVQLVVSLPNGQLVELDVRSTDRTEQILQVLKYIRRAQTLKYYGYIQFDPCITDFPEKGCKVIVSAGNKELNFRVQLPNEQVKEGSFKVTRMRCWRVTSCMHTTNGVTPTTATSKVDVHLELAFEYLMSKDKLQWVSISSQQAIMMSICLQSMVDELMLKKSGGKIKKVTSVEIFAACSTASFVSDGEIRNRICGFSNCGAPFQVQQTPSAAFGFRKSGFGGGRGGSSCVGNDAFEGIGDNDL